MRCVLIFWLFVWKTYIIGLKAPGNYSHQYRSNNFSIILCEGPKNPHFHDFGIFGRVQTPKNQHYLSLDTPGHFNKIKKIHWNILKTLCLYIWQSFVLKCCDSPCTILFLKVWILPFYHNLWRWGSGNNEDWLNKISKILDMNFISINNHEMETW